MPVLDTPSLLTGATYAFAAALQPGPFQAYLISQTVANGFRRTFPAAFAPVLSDLPVVCLVLFFLSNVPQFLLSLLQVAGGFLLFALAVSAYRSFRNFRHIAPPSITAAHQTVLRAALVNLLNPNPYLAWTLILGPLLLKAWSHSALDGAMFLIAFYGVLITTMTGIILLFWKVSALGCRLRRGLLAVSAVALAIFATYQLWAGSTQLLNRF